MKLSLAFHIFNKESTIESVLTSWLDRLSGQHDIEVIPVFDDLRDGSDRVTLDTLAHYDGITVKPLYALNGWEMGCNNLSLAVASGDVIVWLQDDNWIYTPEWDRALVDVMTHVPNVGCVGLLAGLVFGEALNYARVECWGEHKGEAFSQFEIPPDRYGSGVWRVDATTRPLAVKTEVARQLRGIDWAYWPMDWDETDFSWRCHLHGYQNVVVPLDLYNSVGKSVTLGAVRMEENFVRGRRIFMDRYGPALWSQSLGGAAQLVEMLTRDATGRLYRNGTA